MKSIVKPDQCGQYADDFGIEGFIPTAVTRISQPVFECIHKTYIK